MLKEKQPAVFICKKADLGGDLWISQPMRTCVFGPSHEKKGMDIYEKKEWPYIPPGGLREPWYLYTIYIYTFSGWG